MNSTDENAAAEGQPDDTVSDGHAAGSARSEDATRDAEAPPAGPEQQLAELQDRWLRARAEIENVRRALRGEVDAARRYGAAPVLVGLLDVLDNLQRAIANPPADIDPTFLHGLQLIEQQFRTVLDTHGVSAVPAGRGQLPDPNLHRALMSQPTDDVEPGTILHTATPGYRLHDRLLREAQVIIARRPDDATT